MICPICEKNFTPRRSNQKYCTRQCYNRAQAQARRIRAQAHARWKMEWAAWKRDFALGKTVSNLEATA